MQGTREQNTPTRVRPKVLQDTLKRTRIETKDVYQQYQDFQKDIERRTIKSE